MAFNVFFLLYFGLRVSSVSLVARGGEGIKLLHMVIETEIVFSSKKNPVNIIFNSKNMSTVSKCVTQYFKS